MTRVSVKAVFIGTVVDVVLSLVGTMSLATGLLIGGSENPAWFTTTVALNIPTAIFGALLAKRKTANPVAGRTAMCPIVWATNSVF